MKLKITHFDNKFNIGFCRDGENESFLEIKGCKIIEGAEAPFISFPASKNEKTGKWWNHAWGDEKFQKAVIQMARPLAKAPPKPAPKVEPKGSQGSGFEDMPDDIQF